MAVSASVFSVIVRNSTLEESFPGGVEAFRRRSPNSTYCNDGKLSRIGFMLELGHYQGRPVGRLVGDKTDLLSIPKTEWDDSAKITQISYKELRESYDFLGIRKHVECYRHKISGEMTYVGRIGGPAWKINWRGVLSAFRASFRRRTRSR